MHTTVLCMNFVSTGMVKKKKDIRNFVFSVGAHVGILIPLCIIFTCGLFSVLTFTTVAKHLTSDRALPLRAPYALSSYYTSAVAMDGEFISPQSRRVLGLAQDIATPRSDEVLGVTSESNPLVIFEKQQKKEYELYERWKKISTTYPDYADAKLQAAYYAIRTGNGDKANELIRQAEMLGAPTHILTPLRAQLSRN